MEWDKQQWWRLNDITARPSGPNLPTCTNEPLSISPQASSLSAPPSSASFALSAHCPSPLDPHKRRVWAVSQGSSPPTHGCFVCTARLRSIHTQHESPPHPGTSCTVLLDASLATLHAALFHLILRSSRCAAPQRNLTAMSISRGMYGMLPPVRALVSYMESHVLDTPARVISSLNQALSNPCRLNG